ncbi:MAG TPA: hypothetical protein VD789_12980 [Thermomicrobiales bacterium]|nr:hypothetical protein [Thermomicrobiales bacterium]
MIEAEYRMERDHLLEHIVRALAGDERVVAAWLAGSLGRDQADDLSDLDVWVVVRDDSLEHIVANPDGFVRDIVPMIMKIHAPQNAPAGGAYLLTWIPGASGPQQVDWYWQGETTATRPSDTVILFERYQIPGEARHPVMNNSEIAERVASWFREALLRAFIAAKHVRRGDQWAVSRQMQRLANCNGTIEWLLDHRTMPDYKDPIRLALPTDVPCDTGAQTRWIRATIGDLAERLSTEQPAVLQAHERALSSLFTWLDRTDTLD